MPRYEYRCECGAVLILQQSITDAQDYIHICSVCDRPMKRVFSPPGIVFKGGGFYRTDNRSD